VTQEEFEGLVKRLFDEDGNQVAQQLLDAGGDVARFVQEAARGVARAKQTEDIFGRGKRRWEIRFVLFGERTVYFDRLEYHEIPGGTWDRMVESFTVPYPTLA
jgi:hypothetical protein